MLQCRPPLEIVPDALLLSPNSDNTCQQYYRTNVIIIFLQSALQQVHSPLQSEFFTECDLVLPFSIYSIPPLSFKVIRLLPTCSTSYPRHFYPSTYLSFDNVFAKAVLTEDVTNPLVFLVFIVRGIFLSSLTLF